MSKLVRLAEMERQRHGLLSIQHLSARFRLPEIYYAPNIAAYLAAQGTLTMTDRWRIPPGRHYTDHAVVVLPHATYNKTRDIDIAQIRTEMLRRIRHTCGARTTQELSERLTDDAVYDALADIIGDGIRQLLNARLADATGELHVYCGETIPNGTALLSPGVVVDEDGAVKLEFWREGNGRKKPQKEKEQEQETFWRFLPGFATA